MWQQWRNGVFHKHAERASVRQSSHHCFLAAFQHQFVEEWIVAGERNIEQLRFEAYFIGCRVELNDIAEVSPDFPQIAGSMVDETHGNRHDFLTDKLPAQSQKCERQAFRLVTIHMARHADIGKPNATNQAFRDADSESLIPKPSVSLQPLKCVAEPMG